MLPNRRKRRKLRKSKIRNVRITRNRIRYSMPVPPGIYNVTVDKTRIKGNTVTLTLEILDKEVRITDGQE